MILTHKERMRSAIRHEAVDRLPTQINYTHAMGEVLEAHFRVSAEELPARLDNHMIRLDITPPQRRRPEGKTMYDWWGVGFSTEEEGYYVTVNPLADARDLDRFPWPDPEQPGLLAGAARMIEADAGEHFITCNIGFCLFERAWALRGFEAFLLDMALDPPFAEELLERITAIQLALIHRFIKLGMDGGYFGDDYGAQANLLFSPKTWRQMIKPRLARMFKPFLDAGLPVIMHSDGRIADILPDLVEIGLTALNPVQPEVMDHQWLRSTFGESLAYYGGVSTQTVLPNGCPDEVKAAVRACADILAPDGTGLVLAPSHRMMADIPMANVDALLEALTDLSTGP
jgi:uroporphyrinogen decarboxylase